MGSLNKNLKAYVRIDASGRVVAGSLILRKNKPKVGRWKEILTYECCDALTTSTSTTQAALCTTLGSAAQFTVLGSSTVTNTGPTVISGKLGLYPGTSVTGFPPGISNIPQEITSPAALNAQVDATSAFVALSLLANTGGVLNPNNMGLTVLPGVYDVASSLEIGMGTTFNGMGDPNALFVIRIPTSLLAYGPVNLTGGAQAGNIYWIVGSSATIFAEDMKGVIIANTSITFNINAGLSGKAIALNGAVTLDTNLITDANCTINPLPSSSTTTTTTL